VKAVPFHLCVVLASPTVVGPDRCSAIGNVQRDDYESPWRGADQHPGCHLHDL
jgi:hypothetical protein